MSAARSKETESVIENVEMDDTIHEHPDSIPVLPTIDNNEMQPIVDKVVHVTKIFLPPNELNPTGEKLANASESETATSVKTTQLPPVVIQSDGAQLVGSVINVLTDAEELVPVQIQPTYPAAHPLPDVTVDVDHPEKVGEIIPITIQPTYPLTFNAPESTRTENVVMPAYPAAHNLPVPVPVLEETVRAVQITADLVRYGTVVTDGSATGSEVSSSLGEVLYPAAHPLAIATAGVIDHETMKEIPLPPVNEPEHSNQILGEHLMANGQTNVQVTIQERNTSWRRGISLAMVLLTDVYRGDSQEKKKWSNDRVTVEQPTLTTIN